MSSDTRACRSCGTPIIWVYSAAGKRMPLDAERVSPETPGAYVIEVEADGTARGRLASPMFDPVEMPRHLSHFATCPNADQHRRNR